MQLSCLLCGTSSNPVVTVSEDRRSVLAFDLESEDVSRFEFDNGIFDDDSPYDIINGLCEETINNGHSLLVLSGNSVTKYFNLFGVNRRDLACEIHDGFLSYSVDTLINLLKHDGISGNGDNSFKIRLNWAGIDTNSSEDLHDVLKRVKEIQTSLRDEFSERRPINYISAVKPSESLIMSETCAFPCIIPNRTRQDHHSHPNNKSPTSRRNPPSPPPFISGNKSVSRSTPGVVTVKNLTCIELSSAADVQHFIANSCLDLENKLKLPINSTQFHSLISLEIHLSSNNNNNSQSKQEVKRISYMNFVVLADSHIIQKKKKKTSDETTEVHSLSLFHSQTRIASWTSRAGLVLSNIANRSPSISFSSSRPIFAMKHLFLSSECAKCMVVLDSSLASLDLTVRSLNFAQCVNYAMVGSSSSSSSCLSLLFRSGKRNHHLPSVEPNLDQNNENSPSSPTSRSSTPRSSSSPMNSYMHDSLSSQSTINVSISNILDRVRRLQEEQTQLQQSLQVKQADEESLYQYHVNEPCSPIEVALDDQVDVPVDDDVNDLHLLQQPTEMNTLRDLVQESRRTIKLLQDECDDKLSEINRLKSDVMQTRDGSNNDQNMMHEKDLQIQHLSIELSESKQARLLDSQQKESLSSKLKSHKMDYNAYKNVMEATLIKLKGQAELATAEASDLRQKRDKEEMLMKRYKSSSERSRAEVTGLKESSSQANLNVKRVMDENDHLRRQVKNLSSSLDEAVGTMKMDEDRLNDADATIENLRDKNDDCLRQLKSLRDDSFRDIGALEKEISDCRIAHRKTLEMLALAQESLRTRSHVAASSADVKKNIVNSIHNDIKEEEEDEEEQEELIVTRVKQKVSLPITTATSEMKKMTAKPSVRDLLTRGRNNK